MKNNNDLDFLKNKIDEENVQPPESLSADGVKRIIYSEEPRRIKLTQRRGFRVGVTVAACLIAFVAVSAFTVPKLFGDRVVDDNVAMAEVLPNFTSYDQLERMVKKANRNNGGGLLNGYTFGGALKSDSVVEESAAEGGAGGISGDAESYSETYLQVEGVDEADILKNDGRYIYYVSSYGKNEVNIYEPINGEAKLVSTISDFAYDYDETYDYYYSAANENILDIYVYGDKLVLNTIVYSEKDYNELTNTYIYDLSDIENPTVIKSFSQSGYYVSSRMVGSQLYVVSNEYSFIVNATKDYNYAPMCGEGGELESIPLVNIRYVNNCSIETTPGFLVISSIDVEQCKKTADTQAVFGMSADIYCNETNMYAASTLDYEEEKTEIFKISLSRDEIRFMGYATVKGSVNNQFSMDEYNGYFRVAVTDYDYSYTDEDSKHENRLYIFDENMNEVGRINSFAQGESIKAVRFMDDTAYVITYEDIDPLFVMDLSDPTAPEILGEVKISGFSSLLIPVDDNTVLGIGYSTEPSGFEDMERTEGIKLVLFDVSDKTEPKVLDTAVFSNASSNAQNNHKAVAIDKGNGRYAIDYTDLTVYYDDDVYDEYNYSKQHFGAITFEIEDGKIIITNQFEAESDTDYTYASRCTFQNGYLYLFDEASDIYSFKY